jgi:hypothetical protein
LMTKANPNDSFKSHPALGKRFACSRVAVLPQAH